MDATKEIRRVEFGRFNLIYTVERTDISVYVKGEIADGNKIIGRINSDTQVGNLSISIDRDRTSVGKQLPEMFMTIIGNIEEFTNS